MQQLPHIGEPVPKKWLAIREELEQLAVAKPFISQDDYFAVYGRHLEFDRTKALHLSRYLHDLGVFLHFQDDPLLSKTVILQNQWATEAVFRILDDETIKAQRGRFTAADCQRLWAASAYAAMHFELRGLMEKFELCYRLAAPHAEQWLAPQLLSPSKPPELAPWAKPDDLVVRFQYPFLPRGLVSRLMVRQHRFVRRLANCWAHGAFFEHHGTEVLVEETAKGNEIELRARGPEHKALLSVLSSDLEALNDSFKGLKDRVEKLVPCLCATCRQTTEPEMFKQSLLVERKHAGKKLTIECHKSGDDVSLLELLDGLKLDQLPNWAAKPSKPDRLRTIKIFLASSAELREDRDEFDLYFRQQNDHLKVARRLFADRALGTLPGRGVEDSPARRIQPSAARLRHRRELVQNESRQVHGRRIRRRLGGVQGDRQTKDLHLLPRLSVVGRRDQGEAEGPRFSARFSAEALRPRALLHQVQRRRAPQAAIPRSARAVGVSELAVRCKRKRLPHRTTAAGGAQRRFEPEALCGRLLPDGFAEGCATLRAPSQGIQLHCRLRLLDVFQPLPSGADRPSGKLHCLALVHPVPSTVPTPLLGGSR